MSQPGQASQPQQPQQGKNNRRVSFADHITAGEGHGPPQHQQSPQQQPMYGQQPPQQGYAPPPQQQQQPPPGGYPPQQQPQQPPPGGQYGAPPPQQGHGGSFYQPPPNGQPNRPSMVQPPPPAAPEGPGCSCSLRGCALPLRIIAYVGLFFQTGLSLAGAGLPTWLNYTLDNGNEKGDVELGMWRSCFEGNCNSRTDYDWGYGTATYTGYMRQGILTLRAFFIIQLVFLIYFISILMRYDCGMFKGQEVTKRMRFAFCGTLLFSLMTSIWFSYAYHALDSSQISDREVGTGWTVQLVSTALSILLIPSGFFSIPKSPASSPEQPSANAQVVDAWDEQSPRTRTEKVKDFVAKADVRYFLILASFVMYMASMSAPEWTVERTDDNANSYKGPWLSCSDDMEKSSAGNLSMTCNEPYNALAQDEFPILSTTQTLSMIGAILLLVEIFSIFCATSRVIPEKRVRLTLLITTASGALTMVIVAGAWSRQFLELFELDVKDEDDDSTKFLGVGWALLWPVFIFQIMTFMSTLAWKTTEPSNDAISTEDFPSKTTEEFKQSLKDKVVPLASRICCCQGGQAALKVPVYFIGSAAFVIMLVAVGSSRWTHVERGDNEIWIGPSIACLENEDIEVCANSMLALIARLENGVHEIRYLDNGADVAVALNSTLGLYSAGALALLFALIMFVIRAAMVTSYERMSKLVVYSLHVSSILTLLGASNWGYIQNNISQQRIRQDIGYGWILAWVGFGLTLILSFGVMIHARLHDGEAPGDMAGRHYKEEHPPDNGNRASRVSNVAQTPIKERRNTTAEVMPNPMAAAMDDLERHHEE